MNYYEDDDCYYINTFKGKHLTHNAVRKTEKDLNHKNTKVSEVNFKGYLPIHLEVLEKYVWD